VPQDEINRIQQTVPQNAAQATEENITRAAWFSFLGTLISMVAAVMGGYARRTGLPLRSLPDYHGTAVGWQNRLLPTGSASRT